MYCPASLCSVSRLLCLFRRVEYCFFRVLSVILTIWAGEKYDLKDLA